MEEETEVQSNTRHPSEDKPWLFKPGQSGNPGGKPKGIISLKTFARRYIQELTDEEKLEFMAGLPKELVWKMSEGNPENKSDITSDGKEIKMNAIVFSNFNKE